MNTGPGFAQDLLRHILSELQTASRDDALDPPTQGVAPGYCAGRMTAMRSLLQWAGVSDELICEAERGGWEAARGERG